MIDKEFLEKLEAMGPDEVRKSLLRGQWFDVRKKTAEHWLQIQDKKKEDGYNQKKLNLAEEANQKATESNMIARESNTIAKSSKKAAWCAVGIAVLAVVISAHSYISLLLGLLRGFLKL